VHRNVGAGRGSPGQGTIRQLHPWGGARAIKALDGDAFLQQAASVFARYLPRSSGVPIDAIDYEQDHDGSFTRWQRGACEVNIASRPSGTS